ncbi:MAG TPA: HD domain-containing phosphohydrolase [Candidatus Baltobacteraceae bacterium]|jgi:putative nucleotidyltransferase with HDIG domain|nr:HD domain-containing phosphohydrolase [Candidatus Baltobacteraceae bacterium]
MRNIALKADSAEYVQCIERNRELIAEIALNRSLPFERQTLLAAALANRTLDYLIAAMTEADDETLVAWVSISLRGFAREQSLFGLFVATISSTLDILLNNFGASAINVYSWLESALRRIDLAAGASRLEFHEERFTLDSVDAKIDEVLYKLSERDTITAEHSRSVGLWCGRIAKQLDLTKAETLLATRSGLIHDIGKIRTPLEILTAPRALTENEWEIMRNHTLEGVNAIENIVELGEFVPAVRWHHERIDGKGYPDRLDGSRIPLSAKIVAVADAFNAMVARRPYREPLSPSFAIEELKRHRGSHFEERIVNAMIDVVRRLG